MNYLGGSGKIKTSNNPCLHCSPSMNNVLCPFMKKCYKNPRTSSTCWEYRALGVTLPEGTLLLSQKDWHDVHYSP